MTYFSGTPLSVMGARSGTAPGAADADRSRPFLALLFFFSLLLPNHFHLGPLRLAPFLILLLVGFLPLVLLWASGRAGRVRLPDLLILASALWAAFTLLLHHGAPGVEAAGVVLLQTFGAYLLGRTAVRGPHAMQSLIRAAIVGLAVLFPFVLYEAATGDPLYLELFAWLGPVHDMNEVEPRLGLERVQAAFEHPILFGIFASSTFAMIWMLPASEPRRLAAAALVGVSTFFSLSSAAILCLAIQIGILAWNRAFRQAPWRWEILAALLLTGYVAVDLLSNRTPFEVFVSYLTFDPETAYNRIRIWQFGSAEVLGHPLFGIGFNDWDRPAWMVGSVDMFWLVVAMRHGLPAVILLGGACLLLMWRAARRRGLDPVSARLRLGLIVSLIGVFTAVWSVHLWNATFVWVMFLTGCLGWMADADAGPARAAEPEEAPARGRRTWL